MATSMVLMGVDAVAPQVRYDGLPARVHQGHLALGRADHYGFRLADIKE
jgi:hypothetical protein